MKTRKTKLILILFFIIISLLGGFILWANDSAEPMPQAYEAAKSNASVTVSNVEWQIYEPVSVQPTTGFIFYPGGKVDPLAYSPLMKAIAEQGYIVVVVPMPLNLAIFGQESATPVIANFPLIKHWAIGGHSLGGVMAANYAASHKSITGLVLWASYPTSGEGLIDSDLVIGSISGSLDGLSTPDKIEESKGMLPTSTMWTIIDGGNHAQFGWYGDQAGDNSALISRKQQQIQIVDATIKILINISLK